MPFYLYKRGSCVLSGLLLEAASLEQPQIARTGCIGESPSGVYKGLPGAHGLYTRVPSQGPCIYNHWGTGGPSYTPLGGPPIQAFLAISDSSVLLAAP